jgi:hypothetical protein
MIKFVVLLLCFIHISYSHLIEESIDTLQSFVYITKFAFIPTPELMYQQLRFTNASYFNFPIGGYQFGLLSYAITNVKPRDNQAIVIYKDWEKWLEFGNNKDLSCSTKAANADVFIRLSQDESFSKSKSSVYSNSYDEATGTAFGHVTFPLEADDTIEAIWGFVALSNCALFENNYLLTSNSQNPIISTINMSFKNGIPLHFLSYDQDSINSTLGFCVFIQSFLNIFAMYTQRLLMKLNKLHPTARIVIFSVYIQFISNILQVIYWNLYKYSGQAPTGLFYIGNLLQALVVFIIILDVVLVAKGWTIVRRQLSPSGAVKIVLYGTCLLISLLFLEVFKLNNFDSPLSSFIYATTPGILILIIRCCVPFCWFIYASLTTSKNFAKKRGFFKKFIVIFGIYLIAPVIMTLFTYMLPTYDRQGFVTSWELLLILFAQIILVTMYNPSLRYFLLFM